MACAADPFVAKYEPGLERSKQHISVFAIKRDGLLNRSGWAALGPDATVPFSDEPCDVGYGDAMFAAVPEVAEAVDDYVRENGVTDELLDQIAPAAKGDLIMILTLAGHPLAKTEKSESSSYSPSAGPSGRGGRRGNRRSSATNSRGEESSNGETFEAAAAFFSVRERRAVATATLRSSGTNTDQALAQFTNRLEHTFPGSTCSGWDWSVHLDDTKIRKLSEP